MSFLGMVPEEVREHSDKVTTGSERIGDIHDRLDAIVRGVAWVGPDRDAFTEQWAAAGSQLQETRRLLGDRATSLRDEADEQDRVSGDDTQGSFGPSGPLSGSSASDLFGEAGEWLGDRAGEAGEWLGERAGDIGEWVGDRAREAGEWIGEQRDQIEGWFDEKKQALEDWLRERIYDAVGDPDDPDRPWAEIATEKIVDELTEHEKLHHRTEVDVEGVRQVMNGRAPESLQDLVLQNDEIRRTMDTQPPHRFDSLAGAQIRVQGVTGEDGVERYLVYVPPTQGAALHQNMEIFGKETPIPDVGRTLQGWDEQGQPFGWDNNLYAMAGKENAGANAVKAAMEEAGIPPGAEVAFVAHSQGGLVAAQLADDPAFNGGQYKVTDIFSVGSPVQTYTPSDPGTDVTNIQHVEADGRKGDFVPTLDLEGASHGHPDGNPAPNVKDVQFGTPQESSGFTVESDDHRAHESVLWNRDTGEYDPDSAYYGTVANNSDHPDLIAKDERMRGKYYGEGTRMESDVVVDVKRR